MGAFVLDRNYERRKFRVVVSLNSPLRQVLNLENIDNLVPEDRTRLQDLICVAGDVDNDLYKISGYHQARSARITLYSTAILSVAFAVVLYAIAL